MNIPYEWVDAQMKSAGLVEFRPNTDAGLRYSVNAAKKAIMFAHNDGRKTDLTIQPAIGGMNILMNDGSNMILLSISDSSLSINFFKNGYFTGKSVTFPNGEGAYRVDSKAKVTKRNKPVVLSFTAPLLKPHFFKRSAIELTKDSPTTATYRSLVPTDNGIFLEAHNDEESISLRTRHGSGESEFSMTLTKKNGKEVITIKDHDSKDAATFEYRPMDKTLTFLDKKCGFVLNTRGDMKISRVDFVTKEETVTDLGNLLDF